MTDDERRAHREDAQKYMAAAMKKLAKATQHLKACGGGLTAEDLREVQDGLKKVMEFNAAVMVDTSEPGWTSKFYQAVSP